MYKTKFSETLNPGSLKLEIFSIIHIYHFRNLVKNEEISFLFTGALKGVSIQSQPLNRCVNSSDKDEVVAWNIHTKPATTDFRVAWLHAPHASAIQFLHYLNKVSISLLSPFFSKDSRE